MAEEFTRHPQFRDYSREDTEAILQHAPKWTYLYRKSSVRGKVVLSIKASKIAHVLINVNRTGGEHIFYSAHKSGAEQVKIDESMLFESLDALIAEIEAQFGRKFTGISVFEQQLEESRIEAEQKLTSDRELTPSQEHAVASLGKVVMKAMMDGHGNLNTALEAEYKGMLKVAFMTGQASENFLMELSSWREFNQFTQEQHVKILRDLGKTEEDWEHLKQWNQVSADDAQLCVVCLSQRKDAMFPACGHICCCMSCAGALHDCPICRQSFGAKRPIRVFI